MKDNDYKSCLNLNYKEVSWLNKINTNVDNPYDLVLHKMKMGYNPQCRGICPYSSKCEEIWKK